MGVYYMSVPSRSIRFSVSSVPTGLEVAATRAARPVRVLQQLLEHPVSDARVWARKARAAHEAVSVLWSLAETIARGSRPRRR